MSWISRSSHEEVPPPRGQNTGRPVVAVTPASATVEEKKDAGPHQTFGQVAARLGQSASYEATRDLILSTGRELQANGNELNSLFKIGEPNLITEIANILAKRAESCYLSMATINGDELEEEDREHYLSLYVKSEKLTHIFKPCELCKWSDQKVIFKAVCEALEEFGFTPAAANPSATVDAPAAATPFLSQGASPSAPPFKEGQSTVNLISPGGPSLSP